MKIKPLYDRYWENKPLTKFEDYDRNLILGDFIKAFNEKAEILDLGCGDGVISEWLQQKGFLVTSADFNDYAVKSSKSRNLKNVIQLDAEKSLPFEDGFFDGVFWGDVIEHLFDAVGTLSEINRVLKKGGRLILSCPNVGYVGFRLKFLLTGSIRSLELATQDPWEQEHIRFLNSTDLDTILAKEGFTIVQRTGVNRLWHSKNLVKFFPKLLGYIQVVEAVKN